MIEYDNTFAGAGENNRLVFDGDVFGIVHNSKLWTSIWSPSCLNPVKEHAFALLSTNLVGFSIGLS